MAIGTYYMGGAGYLKEIRLFWRGGGRYYWLLWLIYYYIWYGYRVYAFSLGELKSIKCFWPIYGSGDSVWDTGSEPIPPNISCSSWFGEELCVFTDARLAEDILFGYWHLITSNSFPPICCASLATAICWVKLLEVRRSCLRLSFSDIRESFRIRTKLAYCLAFLLSLM